MENKLSTEQKEKFFELLKSRFVKNMKRHNDVSWEFVAEKLQNLELLDAVYRMEQSGGEPDVVRFGEDYAFVDCATESPSERRSCCYDQTARTLRKENQPKSSAVELANSIGINILDEDQYRQLQAVGEFDLKTSSWIVTPANIRKLGGALFCDRRYDTVFTYHNGAGSYYAARGFRGFIKI